MSVTPFVIVLLGALIPSGALVFIVYRITRKTIEPLPLPTETRLLTVRSAFYGTGPLDDRDVLGSFRKNATDGLVISVDNNSLGTDPAPNRPDVRKRLRVAYTYGNDVIQDAVRYEHTRMVLPVDEEFIRSTTTEHEVKRKADLQKQSDEYKDQINTLTQSLASAVTPVAWPHLTLQKVWYVPSKTESTDTYRHKVYFLLTNGGKDVEIWTPLWESAEVFTQSPRASALFREGPKGYMADDWENRDEGDGCLKLTAGRSFKGWIGLTPPHGEGLSVRTNKGTTGTLIFPLKIEGKLTYERIKI